MRIRANQTPKACRKAHTIPGEGLLESVCIDILGKLVCTARRHRYLLFITDWLPKLVKSNPLRGVSAAEVAKQFFHYWAFDYGHR